MTSKLIDKTFENKTILLIEDDWFSYMLVKELLQNSGIRLLHAKEGNQGLQMYKSNKNIDLILMDFRLPVKDGFQATREIKELNPDANVVGYTAIDTDDASELMRDCGIHEYIKKPVEPKKFREMLHSYLKN